MEGKSIGDYQKLLTEVIKKQIVILGPDITLVKARNVPGLTVADDGTVTAISGDPQLLTQKLVEQFMELSGLIVKKTMEPLLGMSGSVQTPAAAMPVTATPSIPPQPPAAPVAQTNQTSPVPISANENSPLENQQPIATPATNVQQSEKQV